MLDYQKIYSDKLLQQTFDDVFPNASKFPIGVTVIAESLFLAIVWEGTTIGQHTIMGMQLKRLVETGKLPMLVLLNPKSKGPKRYRVL